MNEIYFENTKASDVEVLKEIYTYYIDNSTATFHIGNISNTEMNDILFSSDPAYGSFVIRDDNNTLGYVLLSPYKKRQAYRRSAEVTIYLNPNFTGKGIGTKAIDFIEKIAKEREIKTLLSVICGENTSSINLFKKCGYHECGYLKNVGEKFGRTLDIALYQKEL